MADSNIGGASAKPIAVARDFTEGNVPRHMIRLTGFMMMGVVSFMTASLIETIYVGILGTRELAAISFTFPLVMVLQGLSMGLSVGASSVVARAVGVGDMATAKRLVTHCFVLVILLVVSFTAFTYLNVESFFELLGADVEVLDLTVMYMEIWLLGFPFLSLAMVGSTLMRATGDPVTPGYLMTVGSVLHVVIAPFFIFGWGFFPEMGLEGAAVGFIIARSINFLMYLYFMVIRDRLLIFSFAGLLTSSREILHVGFPAVASNLILPISMSITTRLLAGHGAVVVAGYGVASRIETMLFMVIISLSMSVAPFGGQNWGARKLDRVRSALNICTRFSLAWGVFSYVLLALAGGFLVSLINDDSKVVTTATHYLYIMPLAMGFSGIIMTATQSFNALGKPLPALIISILQMIVIYIPLALLGDYLWGYPGIYAASAFTAMVLGGLSWVWIYRVVDISGSRISSK